ncbi:hypothetical protein NSQ26_04730 [Bacillus sp. FSL W7-1360]
MEFKLVADLLNIAGAKTSYTIDRLEEVPFPYDDYDLLKEEDGKWAYGVFRQYMKNQPYLEKKKIFDTKEEGSQFFFLERLSSHYSLTVVHPLLARQELQIYDATFDIPKLRHALSVAGASQDLFYVDEEPDHRAIVLETKEEDYSIAFYGERGEKIFSHIPGSIIVHADATAEEIEKKFAEAPPLELREALFFVFQKVVKLHLFETEVLALLKGGNVNVTFTDKDVERFIS